MGGGDRRVRARGRSARAAHALRAGRETTNDLLVLRSDVYALTHDGRLEAVAPPPFVDLDPEHFGRLADFEQQFPDGPPSLAGCERFVVRGDASFAPSAAA